MQEQSGEWRGVQLQSSNVVRGVQLLTRRCIGVACRFLAM